MGKKRKEFVIHKKLLCDKSDFFRKAFTGSFKEGEGVMYLPDEKKARYLAVIAQWKEKRVHDLLETQRLYGKLRSEEHTSELQSL